MRLQRKISAVVFLAFIVFQSSTDARLLNLSANYLLNFEIINNKTIEFRIKATNVTGWVGLGLNEKSASMDGADIYMGGYDPATELGYGNDYHVPVGGGNTTPTIDGKQDWPTKEITEIGGTTRILIRRLLTTTDTKNDVPIQDKNIYLLWSYNLVSDDVTRKHTNQGVVQVNLIRKGGGESSGVSNVKCTFNTIFQFWALATFMRQFI